MSEIKAIVQTLDVRTFEDANDLPFVEISARVRIGSNRRVLSVSNKSISDDLARSVADAVKVESENVKEVSHV